MDAVEDIKQRLSLEDVVGQYIQLKRAGSNWKGLSPFTNERSPSFMVSPEKQIWHDFSSGRGGDMFTLVMELEGVDFKGALELLARRAGIDLDQYRGSSSSNSKQKERLYAALEQATKFYEKYLSHLREPQAYIFDKRKFTKETVATFRLGYAPDMGDELLKFMQSRGYTTEELTKAGLAVRRYRGLGDMFRGRIMVPLADPQGRVIGFTARLLRDDPNAPKYINTPQTLLYDKSRHIFGLHLAKEAIRKHKYAVIAEGNLDVVASHQAGVKQVVATAGTALTEYQLKSLSRFTPDIRLSFDADSAGVSATERSIPIASKVGVNLSIVTVPSGKDPDELIKQDASKWQAVIDQPVYALDWLIARYQQQLDLSSAQGKRQFSTIILQTVKGLADKVEQEHYVAKVADILGVSPDVLRDKLHQKQTAPPRQRPKLNVQPVDKEARIRTLLQNHLLAMLLMHKPARRILDTLTEDMFVTKEAKKLFTFLRDHPDFDGGSKTISELKDIADYVKVLVFIYEQERYQDLEPDEFTYTLERLQARLIVSYAKSQNTLTNEAYLAAEGNNEKRKVLAEKSKYFQSLLERYKNK